MLANPLGLLALLGIPAVLAIHFLQRKAVQLPVSTLFLLERTHRDAASGRRFERIIPSIPLWMQLLAVLLLTWFLVEPRYPKAGSVQRVAVVLDSSASMTVFRTAAITRLNEALTAVKGTAETLEITVLESVPTRPRLYTGTSITDAAKALEDWTPRDGLTDASASLRLARSLVSASGSVILLTDTPGGENGKPATLPFDADLIAVGKAVENVGFTGVSFATTEGTLVCRALVRNYGTATATRTWWLQTDQGSTEPRPLTIEPGSLLTLESTFPVGARNVRLALSPDAFLLDDVLPLVAPRPKPLNLMASASPAFQALVEKLLKSLESANPVTSSEAADLTIASYDPLDPVLPSGNSVIFVEDPTSTGAYLRGGIVAEPHPLLDGLNWQSLLVRETFELERQASDSVLLWQDKRPLIFLRQKAPPDGRPISQLFFNFDLRLSNATQQPAFIVILHRFAELIRTAKVSPVSANLESGQPIQITAPAGAVLGVAATDPTGLPVPPGKEGTIRSAPLSPGFFTIVLESQPSIIVAAPGLPAAKDPEPLDGKPLLTAAVHFADTREADFSKCGPAGDIASLTTPALREQQTKPDPYWQIGLLVFIAALLVAWKFTEPKAERGLHNASPS